jgi:hypothetical protein
VFLYLLGIESTDSWLSVRLTGALLGQVHLTHDPLHDGFPPEDALAADMVDWVPTSLTSTPLL